MQLLVTAGPGTGKTHTLIERLRVLVDDLDVSPSSVLVLSFTRAAVGEIRRRLRGSNAAYVRPLTFDSFATRLLSHVEPEGPWTSMSFDDRIRRATVVLHAAGDDLDDVRHLIVDEIQDLVGIRRAFVEALVERLRENDGFGLSFFGDPAQGIYNFQLPDRSRVELDGSPALYRWLRASAGVNEQTLSINHRAQTEGAKKGLFAGPLLRQADPDFASIRRDLLTALKSQGRIDKVSALETAARSGTTVILTHTNGQALMISRQLADAGLSHRLQRQATDRCIAPWLGRLLLTGRPTFTKPAFVAMLADLDDAASVDADEAWHLFMTIGRSGKGVASSELVAKRLRRGQVPDDLNVQDRDTLVVSTIHRSKGLEFRNVVLAEDNYEPADVDEGEEARLLFVALSRPTVNLVRMQVPQIAGGYLRLDRKHDRWMICGFKSWQRRGFEVRPADLDTVFPPASGAGRDPVAAQEQLASGLPSDADVRLLLLSTNGPIARYVLEVDGSAMGITTDEFGWELRAALPRSPSMRWPAALSGLRLDGVGTVGGDPNVANAAGLGPAHGWLVPRPVGMAHIEWSST